MLSWRKVMGNKLKDIEFHDDINKRQQEASAAMAKITESDIAKESFEAISEFTRWATKHHLLLERGRSIGIEVAVSPAMRVAMMQAASDHQFPNSQYAHNAVSNIGDYTYTEQVRLMTLARSTVAEFKRHRNSQYSEDWILSVHKNKAMSVILVIGLIAIGVGWGMARAWHLYH
jgi:hypothetical protein